MPLPRVSEEAANTIEAELNQLDRRLADYLIVGGALPSVKRIMARINPAITRSVTAAIREADPGASQATIRAAARDVAAAVQVMVAAAVADARRARKKIEKAKPPADDDGRPARDLAKLGAAVALLVMLRRQPRRKRADPAVTRRLAREVGLKAPKPTAAYAKMVVRTATAEARADVAAKRAAKNGWVCLIEDGLAGPTDHACERVHGRYATPLWVRRHRVEHPNCTRRATPMPLPPGEHVTLLR